MAADLRIFIDKECTQELSMDNLSNYVTALCTSEGLDGYRGTTLNLRMYMKNCGNRAALHVRVIEENDDNNYLVIKVPGATYVNNVVIVGDIATDEVVPIYFCVAVPMYLSWKYYIVDCFLDYYTLPDQDTTYYNPYSKYKCIDEDAESYYIKMPGEEASVSMINGNFFVVVNGERIQITGGNLKIEVVK